MRLTIAESQLELAAIPFEPVELISFDRLLVERSKDAWLGASYRAVGPVSGREMVRSGQWRPPTDEQVRKMIFDKNMAVKGWQRRAGQIGTRPGRP